MNFVKRAGMSLGARKSRAAGLLGIFVVICTLLLGGFLLQAASARQEADAQRDIGVDVTVTGKGLTPALADQLGALDQVHRYTPRVPTRAGARGFTPLVSDASNTSGAQAERAKDKEQLAVNGVRDVGMLLPFSYGSIKITSGRGITPRDAGRKVVLIEQRLAEKNNFEVGDTLSVRSADGKQTSELTIVGVFKDPTSDSSQPVPAYELPGNALYVPARTAEELSIGAAKLSEATYRIGSPEQAEQLHAEVRRLLGGKSFEFRVNDKAYKDQVRPIQRVGAFAGLIVWAIVLAGALILALIVTLQIRERRSELGLLVAMGEKKWKLIGQHALEVGAVALPAVAVAALVGQLAGQPVGDAVFGDEGGKSTAASGAPDAEIEPLEVRVQPATVGKVAGISLGISLVATLIPGVGILRMHPRSILTDSE